MPFKHRFSAFCVALLTVTTSIHAMAWSKEAHRVIAIVAEDEWTPAARAQINRLLAQESGATLASVSTWPDEQRSDRTAKWHYVNFPEGTCKYVNYAVPIVMDRMRTAASRLAAILNSAF